MTDAQRRGGGGSGSGAAGGSGGGGGDEQHSSDSRPHRSGVEPSHRERDRAANITRATAAATTATVDDSSDAGQLFTLLRQLSSRVNRTPSIGNRTRNEASQITAPNDGEPRLAHSLLRMYLDSVETDEAGRRDVGGAGGGRIQLDNGAQISWRSSALVPEPSTATTTSTTTTTTAQQPTHRIVIQDADEVGTHGSSNDGDTTARLEEVNAQDNRRDNDSEGERETGNNSGRVNLNVAIRLAERGLPFVLLLVVIFVWDNIYMLSSIVWMLALSDYANVTIKKQVRLSRSDDMSRGALFSTGTALALHCGLILVYFRDMDVQKQLILIAPSVKGRMSLLDVIWRVMIVDSVVRFATMAIKAFYVLYRYQFLRPTSTSFSGSGMYQQGLVLTAIEHVTLLYRAILPASIWYKFYVREQGGHFFASVVAGIYLSLKITAAAERFANAFLSLRQLCARERPFGRYVSKEEVMESGEDQCAICQDPMTKPVSLRPCRHMFCEDCVIQWLDREKTCPLCREIVKPCGIKSYSNGSTSLISQLF